MQVLLENEKINLTAFAIPILTVAIWLSDSSQLQNRDNKCFRMYFHFLITFGHHFFDPNLFA